MTIQEFSGNMQQAVSLELGSGYTVKQISVDKNNGVTLEALLIKKDGINLSPTIYLNSYYDDYIGGESIRDSAGRLIRDYKAAAPAEDLDMEFFVDYELVRQKLAFKLISSELNTELLEKIPHIPFLDLEIVFYYSVDFGGREGGSILIRNNHMEHWGVKTEDLMRDSMDNTPRLLPCTHREICSMLENMCPETAGSYTDEIKELNLNVITNDQMTLGAAVMLYPGAMEEVCALMGGDFYIIPSSIHELIVVSDRNAIDTGYLKEMIRYVNRTQLAPQDVLSDSLYHFDSETGKIAIA